MIRFPVSRIFYHWQTTHPTFFVSIYLHMYLNFFRFWGNEVIGACPMCPNNCVQPGRRSLLGLFGPSCQTTRMRLQCGQCVASHAHRA